MNIPAEWAVSPSVAAKLGSLVVHVQEGLDNPFDASAASALAADPEVQAWLDSLPPELLPVKR